MSQNFFDRLSILSPHDQPDYSGCKIGCFISDTGPTKIPKGPLKTKGGILYISEGELMFHNHKGESKNISSVFEKKQGEKEKNNIIIGEDALGNSSVIGKNISIGNSSMKNCGKVEYNISIGTDALQDISDNYNIAVGCGAGRHLKGPLANHNIIIGKDTLANAEATCIDIIVLGNNAGANMKGSNFQNIIIGRKAAQYLSSSVISDNNIIFGTEAAKEASNISETITIGHLAGKKIKGARAIIIGSKAGEIIDGDLSDDILIGYSAGNNRYYVGSSANEKSANIFIGSEAGIGEKLTTKGRNILGLGVLAGAYSSGSESVLIGKMAGYNSKQNGSLLFGISSGKDSDGKNNIYMGNNSGYNREGDNNIWIGSGEAHSDEALYNSLLMGSNINKIRGKDTIVIGSEAGSNITGYLNKDILIGHRAGYGQNFSNSRSETSDWICIGSNAGHALTPSLSKGNMICLGHNAGRSEEQNFSNSIFFGNNTGSFGLKINESLIIGHNAGLGAEGEYNTYLGNNNGSSIKGNGNIFIGSHVGDNVKADVSDLFLVGNNKSILMFGEIGKNNLYLTKDINISVNGEGCLYLDETKVYPSSSKQSGSVLYSSSGQLYNTSRLSNSILTLPYKQYFSKECKDGKTQIFEIAINDSNNFLLSITFVEGGIKLSYNVTKETISMLDSDMMDKSKLPYEVSYEDSKLKFFYNKKLKIVKDSSTIIKKRSPSVHKSSLVSTIERVAGIIEIIPSNIDEKILLTLS